MTSLSSDTSSSQLFQRGRLSMPGLDAAAMEAARRRLDALTKPRGSLGVLEALAVRLAGITGQGLPSFSRKAVVVMAADHGVTAQGVSAYPPEVTGQMVATFLAGKAAVNVLARQAGAQVAVVDVGCRGTIPPGGAAGMSKAGGPTTISSARFFFRRVRAGTGDITLGPAMSRAEAEQAVRVGWEVTSQLIAEGAEMVALGEMGIGNTTAASAVAAAFTGLPPIEVIGKGTGVDPAGLARKMGAVERALQVNAPDPADALDVVAKVGGLEIAGLAGCVLAAAVRRVPVIVDGFVTAAAALAAVRLQPGAAYCLVAAHRSPEPGHLPLLRALGLSPLFDLGMRLGEGSGATLAFHLIDAATHVLTEMATFQEAGVSDR